MIHYDDVEKKGRRKISNEVVIWIYHIISICNEDSKGSKWPGRIWQNSLTVGANVKGISNLRGRKSLKLEEELSFFFVFMRSKNTPSRSDLVKFRTNKILGKQSLTNEEVWCREHLPRRIQARVVLGHSSSDFRRRASSSSRKLN